MSCRATNERGPYPQFTLPGLIRESQLRLSAPVTRTVRVHSVPLGSIAGEKIAAYDDSITNAIIPPTVDRQRKQSPTRKA